MVCSSLVRRSSDKVSYTLIFDLNLLNALDWALVLFLREFYETG